MVLEVEPKQHMQDMVKPEMHLYMHQVIQMDLTSLINSILIEKTTSAFMLGKIQTELYQIYTSKVRVVIRGMLVLINQTHKPHSSTLQLPSFTCDGAVGHTPSSALVLAIHSLEGHLSAQSPTSTPPAFAAVLRLFAPCHTYKHSTHTPLLP